MTLIRMIANDQSGISGVYIVDGDCGSSIHAFVYARKVTEMILISGKRAMMDHAENRRNQLIAQWKDEGYRLDYHFIDDGQTVYVKWVDNKCYWKRIQRFYGSDTDRWKWYLSHEGEIAYRKLNGYQEVSANE